MNAILTATFHANSLTVNTQTEIQTAYIRRATSNTVFRYRNRENALHSDIGQRKRLIRQWINMGALQNRCLIASLFLTTTA